MRSILVAAAVAVAAPVHAQLVKIDGSSTVFPITEAVAEDFQKAKKQQVKVTVGISGTGGGFKKFCRGETDISDASRPISAKEMQACAEAGIKYVELPVAFDALTVVINPKNNWIKELKVEELKKMWEPAAQGKITRWNQVNPAWPNAPLKLFGPGADSGTFDYFTDAINGKEKASRGDFTASEDDNVLVQGVSRDVNAIGYFGLAYYVENKDKLKAAPIVNKGATKAVAPSVETVMDGTYQPLARPIFIYVSDKAMQRPEVGEFVEYYLKNAPQLVKEVGYVPLSSAHYSQAMNNFKSKKLGTGFGGKNEVGIRVEELLAREGKL
jgi:phosphate transport system substrate-binding protein